MMELIKDLPDHVVGVVAKGRITSGDYDKVLIPAVDAALKRHPKVRMLYCIEGFDGIDPSAAWEDLKVGMEHFTRWERIAVVTDVEWLRHTMNAFGFLMPGKVRVYDGSERAAAQEWLLRE